MTYNLTIGKQVESSFVNAGERIAQTAKFGKIDAIRENLEKELFFKNGTSSAEKAWDNYSSNLFIPRAMRVSKKYPM